MTLRLEPLGSREAPACVRPDYFADAVQCPVEYPGPLAVTADGFLRLAEPVDPYWRERVDAAVALVPAGVRRRLVDAGTGLDVTAGPITNHPRLANLGTPPGRPAAEIYGVGGFPGLPAVVRQSAPAHTVLHELAHTLDAVAGFPSRSPGWHGVLAGHPVPAAHPGVAAYFADPGEGLAEWLALSWAGVPVPAAVADSLGRV